MTNRDIILNELADLGSSLRNQEAQNFYTVPTGYFEELANQIMSRIKALEASNTKEELAYLSSLFSNASKEIPYAVPAGYFQNLSDAVLQRINEHKDHQINNEEIEILSPLLSSLKNKNPYSVPVGYFESLETNIEKKESKVISITSRRWYRLAVAAVVFGVIVIGGLLFIRKGQPDINKNPQAWINKNVNKKVSTDKIDEFVKLAEGGTLNTVGGTDADKQTVKELMKDVSEKEIEDFLNEAVALESNDETNTLMN